MNAGDRNRFQYCADHVHAAFRRQRVEQRIPVHVALTVTSSRSSDPAIALIAAESRLATTWCAPNPARFIGLAGGGGERGDVAAPRGSKLDRHVAEATDADHTDTRGGRDVVGKERLKHGDAAAQ